MENQTIDYSTLYLVSKKRKLKKGAQHSIKWL